MKCAFCQSTLIEQSLYMCDSFFGRLLLHVFLLLMALPSYGQTSIERYDPSAMPNNTVVYALPLTRVALCVTIRKTTETPGSLHIYAYKHLGVKDVISRAAQHYELEKVEITTYGVPDPDNRYEIKLRTGTTAPFVYLTGDGLLCAVNADYTEDLSLPKPGPLELPSGRSTYELPPMSREYVQATTDRKRAEILAREIFRLRESRLNVVSGDADRPFPDGQAMKLAIEGLDEQERMLTAEFVGTRLSERSLAVVSDLRPDSATTLIACRMSPDYGLLPADDLRGEPVYLRMEVTEQAPLLTQKEDTRRAKRLKGLVYNVPGKMKVTVLHKGKTLAQRVVEVAQLGIREALDPSLFNTRRGTISVTLYPVTGAIRKIVGSE